MFQKTYLKLSGLYLLIMMAISIFFSINLYRVSVREFDRDKIRQGDLIDRIQFAGPLARQFIDQREQQVQEAKDNILNNLILTNIFILVGCGFISYYLARRTLEPIEEAHIMQSRFTADASHELRTPIAAMQTEIEVALMNPKLTLAQAKKQLGSNLEELARLTALSEGLLKLAQLQHNEIEKQPVKIGGVLQQAVSTVAVMAEDKHVLIRTPEECSEIVTGDKSSLTQAFVTVLDNAVKYSPEKTEINISCIKEHRNLMIEIRDQGIGIKAGDLPYIFDRFYRSDSARTGQKSSGYGLGLAIAKNIIELHQGSISATSDGKKGSTFRIQLPLKRTNVA